MNKKIWLIVILFFLILSGYFLFSNLTKEIDYSHGSPNSQIKRQLNNIRGKAEVFYESNDYSYSKKSYTLGPCIQTKDTLFGVKDIFENISLATNNNPSRATCVSQGFDGEVKSYAVSVPLFDYPEYSWCIDSTGLSKQIVGVIKSDFCQ